MEALCCACTLCPQFLDTQFMLAYRNGAHMLANRGIVIGGVYAEAGCV